MVLFIRFSDNKERKCIKLPKGKLQQWKKSCARTPERKFQRQKKKSRTRTLKTRGVAEVGKEAQGREKYEFQE